MADDWGLDDRRRRWGELVAAGQGQLDRRLRAALERQASAAWSAGRPAVAERKVCESE